MELRHIFGLPNPWPPFRGSQPGFHGAKSLGRGRALPSCRVQPAPTQGFPARDWHSWVLIPHSITTPWGGRQRGRARVGSYGLGCLTPAGVWKGKEVPESMRTPPLWGHPAVSTKWRGRATHIPGQALSCARPHLAVQPSVSPRCGGALGHPASQHPAPCTAPAQLHLRRLARGCSRSSCLCLQLGSPARPVLPAPTAGLPGAGRSQGGFGGEKSRGEQGAESRQCRVLPTPPGGSQCSPAPCSHAPPAVMLSAMRDLGL